MNDHAQLWADPRLVYPVAAAAVALLLATIWLFKRQKRQGRQAGLICLILSVLLHAALIFLVPMLSAPNGGSTTVEQDTDSQAGIEAISLSTFDPDLDIDDTSAETEQATIAPLPVANLTDLLSEPEVAANSDPAESAPSETQPPNKPEPSPESDLAQEPTPQNEPDLPTDIPNDMPGSLAMESTRESIDPMAEFGSQFDQLLSEAFDSKEAFAEATPTTPPPTPAESKPVDEPPPPAMKVRPPVKTASAPAPKKTVVGGLESDYANRTGAAKVEALQRTGGDEDTEAAVEAALRFLADAQRANGAWDPRASGAGVERAPLGMNRGGAGTRAENAITGLALLTMMGAGHTHQKGDYAENVYRGLAHLIRDQKPDGSLAGDASIYASTYSHGMAALAMCEAAAITKDPSAIASGKRALAYTTRMQHPTTGGWRYTAGDPGDLSQLGWQAMVLDAGHRASIPIDARAVTGVERFLRSVRLGAYGGLASYRPGEAASRTMTAEALATRLLIGQQVPEKESSEAARYLLQQPPGIGQDNYYYWYYATLALHQLQDDSWQLWNDALKKRLLATQRDDGSWGSQSVWGGYGGTVYTTSMATLCLETYYRHAIRENTDRIATQPSTIRLNR